MDRPIKFIDLFTGLGGMRIGLENACNEIGIAAKCVFTSEIKHHAIKTYQNNSPEQYILSDIATIQTNIIPEFDLLLAGFPCQPFYRSPKKSFFAKSNL
jgi:DNA (cytosine-5)-methyltransferase 1